VVATAVEAVAEEVAAVHAAVVVRTEVVVEEAHVAAVVALRERLRYREAAEDNDRTEAATGLVTELAWSHKVAAADPAVPVIGPVGMSVHDQLRAGLLLYLETLAGDGPVARAVDQVRAIVPVAASGLLLAIGLEVEAGIVLTAATGLGWGIDPARQRREGFYATLPKCCFNHCLCCLVALRILGFLADGLSLKSAR
jgi:hypothetical protein